MRYLNPSIDSRNPVIEVELTAHAQSVCLVGTASTEYQIVRALAVFLDDGCYREKKKIKNNSGNPIYSS